MVHFLFRYLSDLFLCLLQGSFDFGLMCSLCGGVGGECILKERRRAQAGGGGGAGGCKRGCAGAEGRSI